MLPSKNLSQPEHCTAFLHNSKIQFASLYLLYLSTFVFAFSRHLPEGREGTAWGLWEQEIFLFSWPPFSPCFFSSSSSSLGLQMVKS
jgi:hypothetical protein